jgi:hypothetical protein
MKINILVLLFAGFLAFSCKKKNSETKSTNPPNSSLNSFTLKKDGMLYTPNTVLAGLSDEDMISIETYMVYGQPENNAYGLFVRKSITPGIYLLEDGESGDFGIYHSQDASNFYGWSDGTLNVLSNDTTAGVLHCKFDVYLYNDDCKGNCPHITDGEMTIHY